MPWSCTRLVRSRDFLSSIEKLESRTFRRLCCWEDSPPRPIRFATSCPRSKSASILSRPIGRQAGVERLHPQLLRHTFACLYLMRYRDPFALMSLLGHTTLQMTNHYCEAVQQMDVIRAVTTSIVDGIDTRLLDINRRGRLARKQTGRREGLPS
jgi:hypothetical protein